MPKKPQVPIALSLSYESATVLRSLIHGAIGGDVVSNRARVLLNQVSTDLEVAGVPAAEWDCFFVAHVEMTPAEKRRRRKQ